MHKSTGHIQLNKCSSLARGPELEVCFFSVDSYLTVEDDPPVLITPDDMLSQACRFRLIHRELRELNPGDTELQTDPKDSKTGDLRIGYSEYVC